MIVMPSISHATEFDRLRPEVAPVRPPFGALAIDGAPSGDGDVLHPGRGDEVAVVAVALPFCAVVVEQQRCSALNIASCSALVSSAFPSPLAP